MRRICRDVRSDGWSMRGMFMAAPWKGSRPIACKAYPRAWPAKVKDRRRPVLGARVRLALVLDQAPAGCATQLSHCHGSSTVRQKSVQVITLAGYRQAIRKHAENTAEPCV